MVLINCKNKSETILDEGFVRIFAPYRFIQKILGSCRVDVTGRIVAAPTVFQKCYTIICLMASSFFCFQFIQSYGGVVAANPRTSDIFMFGFFALNLVFSMSTFHSRLLDNQRNVKLYVKMQTIDKSLKINNNDNNIQALHYKHNSVVVLGMVTVFIAHLIISLSLTKGKLGVLEITGAMFPFYSFLFELCCCSSHIFFFTNRVRVINSIIINHFKNRVDDIETLSKRCATVEQAAFETSKTDVYLEEILNTFSCFQKRYRFQVFIFCGVFFSWMTLGFRYAIFVLQRTAITHFNIFILDFVFLGIMAMMNINMIFWICIRTEAFLREVKKTKKLSIITLSRYNNGPLSQKAKRMFKLIEDTPPSFSVYGMWCMDAKFLLSMFQLVTNAYVILLQFVFL